MTAWGDERGQAIQVGAILLFAFLVLAFAGYQAVLVPQQNAAVEATHAQQVGDDVVEFRSAVVDAWSTERPRAATVHLGTTYPPRLLGLNPAPPGGTLRTTTEGELTVVVEAQNPGQGRSSRDVTADACGSSPVVTRAVTYTPDYNEYRSAPTFVYENGVVYRQFDDAVLFDSGQLLVQGETVNLTPLVTAYSASGTEAQSVNVIPAENAPTTVTVGQNQELRVSFPSRLGETQWEQLLAGQVDANSVEKSSGRVTVSLTSDQGATEYTVVCRPVGLDRAP